MPVLPLRAAVLVKRQGRQVRRGEPVRNERPKPAAVLGWRPALRRRQAALPLVAADEPALQDRPAL
jgi:hypothetical protein